MSLVILPNDGGRGHGFRDYRPQDTLPWGQRAGDAKPGCYNEDGTFRVYGMPGSVLEPEGYEGVGR
jgi:hypothetical protein